MTDEELQEMIDEAGASSSDRLQAACQHACGIPL